MSTEEIQNSKWVLVDRKKELYELRYENYIYMIELEDTLSRFSKNKKYMALRTTVEDRVFGGFYFGSYDSIDDAKLEIQKDIMELKDSINETP